VGWRQALRDDESSLCNQEVLAAVVVVDLA